MAIRNDELARKIVLQIEGLPAGERAGNVEIEGFSHVDVQDHVGMLYDEGLVRAKEVTTLSSEGRDFLVFWLTPEGRAFAEAARNDTVWRRVMKRVAATGAVALAVLKDMLIEEAKKYLGE